MAQQEEMNAFELPDVVLVEVLLYLPVPLLDSLFDGELVPTMGDILVDTNLPLLKILLADREVVRRLCERHQLHRQESFEEFRQDYNYWYLDAEETPYEYFAKHWRRTFGIAGACCAAARKSGADERYLALIHMVLKENRLRCCYALIYAVVKTLREIGAEQSVWFPFLTPSKDYFDKKNTPSFFGVPVKEELIVERLAKYTPAYEREMLSVLGWHDFCTVRHLIETESKGDRMRQLKYALDNDDCRVARSFHPSENEILCVMRLQGVEQVSIVSKKVTDVLFRDRFHPDVVKYYRWNHDCEVKFPSAQVATKLIRGHLQVDLGSLRVIIAREVLGVDCSEVYEEIIRTLLSKKGEYDPICIQYFIEKILSSGYSCSEDLLSYVRTHLPKKVAGDPEMEEWVVSLQL